MNRLRHPPNCSIRRERIVEYIAVLTNGIFMAMLIGPFSNSGRMLLRYTFSSTSGTLQITVGRVICIASIRILGEGMRPKSVIWAPQAN